MMRIFNLLVLLTGLTSVLAGCGPSKKILPSGKAVRIGVLGPFSGPDEALGTSGMKGIELALTLRPLLANGDHIELVIEDDRSDPAYAPEALARLKEQEVSAVLLLSRSDTVLALGKNGTGPPLPMIATIATHTGIITEFSFLIQLSFSDSEQAAVAENFLHIMQFEDWLILLWGWLERWLADGHPFAPVPASSGQ